MEIWQHLDGDTVKIDETGTYASGDSFDFTRTTPEAVKQQLRDWGYRFVGMEN